MPQRFDANLANDLRVVVSRFSNRMDEDIRTATVSTTERNILTLLATHIQLKPSLLAEQLHVTRQAVSQSLKRLERMNYVRRHKSRDDRRSRVVTLTDAGRVNAGQRKRVHRDWLTTAISEGCTENDRQTLVDAVVVLTKLMVLK